MIAASVVAAALLGLALPGAGLADHITISAVTVARLKEHWTPTTWIVEVTWTVTCNGAGSAGALYHGSLNVVDVDTNKRTYLGGVSTATGTASAVYAAEAKEQHLKPELDISCSDYDSLHGASTVALGPGVTVPALYDNGEGGHGRGGGGGGGSGGGSGGSDPTAPMRTGGCRFALQGTDKPETLTGTAASEIVFGYGGDDRIRGASGHDCLLGGRGNDKLLGEAGDDRLTGGSGNDVLTGGAGTNAYDAGRGNDVVYAANKRRELVRCGPGTDHARVDRRDRVAGCERVTRVS
jgi:Ca2+-binding RTX toxin-like protein